MKTASGIVFFSIMLAGLTGCASTPIVGHGANQTGRYEGDVGVSGNGTTLTVQAGSNVSKLSIIGDGCKVTVEDGAQVDKIEFWGNGSTVTIPDNLQVSIAAVGTNQVIRRPVGTGSPAPAGGPAPPGRTAPPAVEP